MESNISIYDKIGDCCVSALISEVSATPKPGLVDRLNSGAHKDMDFNLFIVSVEAIAPYFKKFAEIGGGLDSIDEFSLGKLRPLGIECEKAMFRVTQGVNTHKGVIFSIGIISAAAGFCYKTQKSLNIETICSVAGKIGKESDKDFYNEDREMTKGKQLYYAYGIRGVRGEAASGFLSVRNYALPVMNKLINEGYDENDINLQVLLNLMANVTDTNVISRGGIDGALYQKSSARKALDMGGALTPEGKKQLYKMDNDYIKRNISPGGCADLLSAAITLHSLENI